MKNFKKITGIMLALSLVVTQFPISGGKQAKAATETGTKTDITASKISFDYEKAKQEEATSFTFCGTDVSNFSGNGDYEIENAGQYSQDGYQNIGYFNSDVSYTLKNVILVVNDTYEFVLEESKDSGYKEDSSTHEVAFSNIYWIPDAETPVCETNDKSAALKYNIVDDNTKYISLYVSDTKTDITSSKIKFTYEKVNPGNATSFTFCDNNIENFDLDNDGHYEIENAGQIQDAGYQNIGYFKSDATYTLKNVILTVNNTYDFLLKETVEASKNDKGEYEVSFANMWSGYEEGNVIYTSEDGKATLVSGGNNVVISLYVTNDGNTPDNPGGDDNTPDNPGDGDDNTPDNPGGDDNKPDNPGGDDNTPDNPGGGDVQEPSNVKTEITSSKLSFTYEKTGEGDATYLKVCGVDVNGFNGDGTYEVDIAEAEWSTWDKNGFYNLGFIASDVAYTLKNVVLIVNGTYEFVLDETKDSSYNEQEASYKADCLNIWGGHEEGDVLYTSKDGKAQLISGGNNVVISLYVSSEEDKPQQPGGDDTQQPERVTVNIKSSKLSFTYEKTGEGEATFLKVSGTDVSNFKGNGDYEVDVAEAAWSTWDKTGYYNLGFIASDAAYTLKNVVLTVNGTYEFVLGATKDSVYNEEEKSYKADFLNMWSGHKEGEILYTSKDGKAVLVSGGNTAVISLCVDKDVAPTPRPYWPPYITATSAPVTTAAPTIAPTPTPASQTAAPTTAPAATTAPTVTPAIVPTTAPVATVEPTVVPTTAPDGTPTAKPAEPSNKDDGDNGIQKGSKVTVSGQKYEVTNNSKKTVAYVAPKNSKKTAVSVPATVKVTVDGKKVTYKVTSIKDKAFKGNKNIKTVTVSKNIKSIGKNAFKNCSKLKTIVIKSTSITKVGKDALKGTAKNLVIKVPAKKAAVYKKLFKNKGNNSIVIKKA